MLLLDTFKTKEKENIKKKFLVLGNAATKNFDSWRKKEEEEEEDSLACLPCLRRGGRGYRIEPDM